MLTVQVIDVNRIYLAINDLSDVDRNKTIKKGLRKATKFFVTEGKSNIKVRKSGNLYKSVTNKLKRRKLGALAGFDSLGRHAHLVDSGTANRYTSRGYNRGVMKGNNFWTSTVNTNGAQALEILYNGIEEAVNRIMLRNG